MHQRIMVLYRVGKMLRRKVGHEREDKAYDQLMRTKTQHIIIFSMTGVVSMIIGGCVTWYTGEFRTDTTWDTANPTMKTVILCLQIIVSLTTVVACCLITQFYRLLLINKRKEWSGIDDPTNDMQSRTIEAAYSFWRSSWLKNMYILEILIHVIHPLFVFQSFSTSLYTLCQIFMFTRLYLFSRMLHTFSRPYKLRIEIINSNREFQTMNLRIKMGLTLKMLFYNKTVLVLCTALASSITVFSFMIFLLERNEQKDEFGRLENVLWFSFITFTTIGFGDFVPQTISGRICTVLLGITGVVITTIFSGVLTNKLAPTKIQRYIVEYLAVRSTLRVYEEKAAFLLQAVFKQHLLKKRKMTSIQSHKSNKVYGAIKGFRRARFDVKGAILPSMDPVLEDKLTQLKHYLVELDHRLQEQHTQVRTLQQTIDYEMASILRTLGIGG